jgi:hypothetical protein
MIEYLPGSAPTVVDLTAEVEYVGGPRGGQREDRHARPKVIEADGGEYRRSFQCADDGTVRYVWKPGPTEPPERSVKWGFGLSISPIPQQGSTRPTRRR